MKKLVVMAMFFLSMAFLAPNQAFAHPGDTDRNGCHTCRTNCYEWDLYYGQYHCHNSGKNIFEQAKIKSECMNVSILPEHVILKKPVHPAG